MLQLKVAQARRLIECSALAGDALAMNSDQLRAFVTQLGAGHVSSIALEVEAAEPGQEPKHFATGPGRERQAITKAEYAELHANGATPGGAAQVIVLQGPDKTRGVRHSVQCASIGNDTPCGLWLYCEREGVLACLCGAEAIVQFVPETMHTGSPGQRCVLCGSTIEMMPQRRRSASGPAVTAQRS